MHCVDSETVTDGQTSLQQAPPVSLHTNRKSRCTRPDAEPVGKQKRTGPRGRTGWEQGPHRLYAASCTGQLGSSRLLDPQMPPGPETSSTSDVALHPRAGHTRVVKDGNTRISTGP
ncbi:Hypothetical predicted protein [Marmota monax]|uniref:Uncharacterized protein n=1 Tax=Marmota monax TaxID=9995 RepID=A0A5E4CWW8_MARMO|nr:Hypothetical predicted protein [Marmota monax]